TSALETARPAQEMPAGGRVERSREKKGSQKGLPFFYRVATPSGRNPSDGFLSFLDYPGAAYVSPGDLSLSVGTIAIGDADARQAARNRVEFVDRQFVALFYCLFHGCLPLCVAQAGLCWTPFTPLAKT